jgi:hypothetical protein
MLAHVRVGQLNFIHDQESVRAETCLVELCLNETSKKEDAIEARWQMGEFGLANAFKDALARPLGMLTAFEAHDSSPIARTNNRPWLKQGAIEVERHFFSSD